MRCGRPIPRLVVGTRELLTCFSLPLPELEGTAAAAAAAAYALETKIKQLLELHRKGGQGGRHEPAARAGRWCC